MIKVLIVEDSAVTRALLVHILGSDQDIQIIGTASNGEEAVSFVEKEKPDVITMDINMPKMNGFEAIRRIISTNPIPIVIVSSTWETGSIEATFKAVEVGAVSFAEKPWGLNHPDYLANASKLIETVKLMSEVKVIRRWLKSANSEKVSDVNLVRDKKKNIKIICIGVSTGGPLVVQKILEKLPKDLSVPIVIVQHITVGFLGGLVDWLNNTSALPVHVAKNNEVMLPGNVYFAAEKYQMKITHNNKIVLTDDEDENGIRPSVSYLFRSIAEIYKDSAIGILLTGMGRDGAKELLEMKERGCVTIAQDKETSIVHGMPGEAIKIGAAQYVLSPDKIVEFITGLFQYV